MHARKCAQRIDTAVGVDCSRMCLCGGRWRGCCSLLLRKEQQLAHVPVRQVAAAECHVTVSNDQQRLLTHVPMRRQVARLLLRRDTGETVLFVDRPYFEGERDSGAEAALRRQVRVCRL
jgi:hypothetical protein